MCLSQTTAGSGKWRCVTLKLVRGGFCHTSVLSASTAVPGSHAQETEATWRCPHPQLPEVLLSASMGTQDPGGLRCDNRYQRLLEACLAAFGGLLEVAVINL